LTKNKQFGLYIRILTPKMLLFVLSQMTGKQYDGLKSISMWLSEMFVMEDASLMDLVFNAMQMNNETEW
jgi:hypothetical protein